MKNLKGKNCLITGAASGIGRSLAIGLAKEGMNLFLADIDMDGAEKVKGEVVNFNTTIFAGRCDVSNLEDVFKHPADSKSQGHEQDDQNPFLHDASPDRLLLGRRIADLGCH